MIASNRVVRVMVAGDLTLIRKAFISLLKNSGNMLLVGEVPNRYTLLSSYRDYSPDVILLLFSSAMDSFISCKKITESSAQVKTIIVTPLFNEKFIPLLMHIGTDGYITYNVTNEELIHSIMEVSLGQKYYCCGYDKMINKNSLTTAEETGLNVWNSGHKELTEREKEVLALIGEGMTSVQISEKLSLSKRTVDNFRAGIMQKLNIKTLGLLLKTAVLFSVLEAL
jgi:DNA-binding NarL/FixJ family response regulator